MAIFENQMTRQRLEQRTDNAAGRGLLLAMGLATVYFCASAIGTSTRNPEPKPYVQKTQQPQKKESHDYTPLAIVGFGAFALWGISGSFREYNTRSERR